MSIDGQPQGLLGGGGPPLVEGGIVLPEFAQAGAFPAAAGLGVRFWLADEVGKMGADKGRDRLPMALETKAAGQFIGHPLKVGRLLQRNKRLEELAGFRWPIRPVVATGALGGERSAFEEPARAKAVLVRATDLEMVGRFRGVDLPVVKLLEEVLKKGIGEASGQLFFSWFRMAPDCPLVEGLCRPPLRSGLLSPSTKGQFP